MSHFELHNTHMRHTCTPAGTEQQSPYRRLVRQGMGEKEAAASEWGARNGPSRYTGSRWKMGRRFDTWDGC